MQHCSGGTPVQGQTSNSGYDASKPVIGYLTGYQLTDHRLTSL